MNKYTDVMKPEEISVATLWIAFSAAVLSADAGPIQREEMRKAFYAGFTECFKIMTDISSELPEAESFAVLSRISKEANDFFEVMIKEHL